MTTATRWWKYGPCEECDADAGQPCLDLRYASATGRFPALRPHPGRHVRGYLPRRREDAR